MRIRFGWPSLAVVCLFLAGCGARRDGSLPRVGDSTPAAAPEISAPVKPSRGAGSSGGGHGLTDQGKLMLRELVEGTVCEWVDGPHFFDTYVAPESEVKDWPSVMLRNRLGYLFYFLLQDHPLLHAYFDETIQLNVCLSKQPLRQLPETVDQSIASYRTADIDQKKELPTQIAIRIGNDIFIDQKAYESLDAINREYLRFHEVMHAFIPMDTPARMTRLRDFVAGVRALDRQLPQEANGRFRYSLDPEFNDLLKKLREEFELLKENDHVNVWPDDRTAAQGLVNRYVLLGDLNSLQVVFDRNHLNPMQKGADGVPLFDELIFTLRECEIGDQRRFCQNALALLRFYLERGADPDMAFTTGEWKAMPVWEYLLFSSNRAARAPRLRLARELFAHLHVAGQHERSNTVLFRLCADNLLALAVDEVLSWGADVNARDAQGLTPLLAAVEKKGHGNNLFMSYPATHLIGVLIAHGADLSVKNAAGKTALEIMKDFKGPLRPLYDNTEIYQLGVKALEVGPAGLEGLRPEFERFGMPLPR